MSSSTPRTLAFRSEEPLRPCPHRWAFHMTAFYCVVEEIAPGYAKEFLAETAKEASNAAFRPDTAASLLLHFTQEFADEVKREADYPDLPADFTTAVIAADALREAISCSHADRPRLLADFREALFGTREEEIEIARLYSANGASIPALRMEDLPHGQWDRRGLGPEKAVLGKALTGGGEHLHAAKVSRLTAEVRALRGVGA